jgi:hypothetical protein
MTPEYLQMLSKMVGGLGLRVTVVDSLEGLGVQAEDEPQPVPITRDDSLRFAREHGFF